MSTASAMDEFVTARRKAIKAGKPFLEMNTPKSSVEVVC